MGSLFSNSSYGGGRLEEGKFTLSKTRLGHAEYLKFGMYVHTYMVLENIPYSTRSALILLMSVFVKSQYFMVKTVPSTKAIV